MSEQLIVSASPHIRARVTTRRIMLDVIIALMPCLIAGIVFFGWYALALTAISVGSCVLTEIIYSLVYRRAWKDFKGTMREIVCDFDFTGVVTGIILALILPVGIEWYLPLLGGIFAIALCKMLFGGTGRNLVNPADTARIFLFISFASMTTYVGTCLIDAIIPVSDNIYEVLSEATPLTAMVDESTATATLSPLDLFLGTGVDGCIGETCKLAILVGYAYLALRRVIKWYYPLIYIIVAGLFASALDADISMFATSVLSGGLMFGAVFMATDYCTSPKSTLANIVYFVCLGLLTAGLRKATGMEVVSFCILLMNCLTPLLDRYIPRRPFGYVREKKTKPVAGGGN